ncbi:hypothetical protein K501DRAFT_278286 [Backusella circina FSU 941]|nr:hypothetical protein K501DRAFT_278286 [Backusella circina FSU 941]
MNSRGVLACASDSFHRPAGLTNNKEDGVGLIILGLAPISASRMEILPFPIILERSLSMFLNNSYVMGFGKKTGRNSWSVEPGKWSKTTMLNNQENFSENWMGYGLRQRVRAGFLYRSVLSHVFESFGDYKYVGCTSYSVVLTLTVHRTYCHHTSDEYVSTRLSSLFSSFMNEVYVRSGVHWCGY